MTFVFTTLAEYQSIFWIEIGKALREQGHEVVVLSYDDISHKMVSVAGIMSLQFSDFKWSEINEECPRYLDNRASAFWASHERYAYEIGKGDILRDKFERSYSFAFSNLRSLPSSEAIVIQELGGFVSVLGAYAASRQLGIRHIFIEPSFYRGRIFITEDGFEPITIREGNNQGRPSHEVHSYIQKVISTQALVIPQKDKLHYRGAFQKIASVSNIKALGRKLIGKYIFRRYYEFGYILNHVKSHLEMAMNDMRLKKFSHPVDDIPRPFVYYPLHVPGDVALTLRSPEYLDQLSLIELLARSLPFGYSLAIKEHPAKTGAVNYARFKKLLETYDNVYLVRSSENNHRLLKHADVVVTVNSKSGAEAMLYGKAPLVLGKAFYTESNLSRKCPSPADIPRMLLESILNRKENTHENVYSYFQEVWNHSYPGELYFTEKHNVKVFATSLIKAIKGIANGEAPPQK